MGKELKRYIHTADAIFALILFCAFAVSMLMVLMMGARAYKNIRNAVENHYSEETCVSYIATKVRHYDDLAGGDSAGDSESVYLSDIGGVPALYFAEEFEGTRYLTALYCVDGNLKELYTEQGEAFDPGFGEDIIAVDSVSFEITDSGILRVACTGTGGGTAEISLMLRSRVSSEGGFVK